MSPPIRRSGRLAVVAELRPLYLPPLLLWTAGLVVGVALSLATAGLWIVALSVLCATALSFTVTSTRNTTPRNRTLHAALILFAPTLLAVGFWRAESSKFEPDSLALADLGAQIVRLEGAVIEDPQFSAGGIRFLVSANRIAIGDEQRSLDQRVLLHSTEPTNVAVGDRISARAVLSPTARATDDYLARLANRRIAASGLAAPGSVRIESRGRSPWWQRAAADARTALNERLRDALPPPLSAIAQGMVTGRRDAIDSDLRGTLNDTSLSHLIVISGSNLTLLTTIVMAATAWLLGRRSAAGLAIVAALSYGTLVGPDPPVQRAMWMAIVFAASHLLGRGASALAAVTATAGLMIALEPHILVDLSFQLTLAGTLGIVLLMPSLTHDFLSGQRGLAGSLRDAALLTMVASLATMPLIILHFERAALIGIPANLLAAPLFAWMLLGSAGTALIGLASESAAAVLAWPLAWLPLRWLVIVAESLARLPGAGVPVIGFGHAHLLLIYGAVLAVAFRPHRDRVRRWYRSPPSAMQALPNPLRTVGLDLIPNLPAHLSRAAWSGVLAGAAAAIWLSACAAPSEQLRVHFIDVGQGDAALIVTPDGHSILIDAGDQPDAIRSSLRRHLPANARSIDLLIITHPQSDHGEALWAITDFYDIKRALVNPHFESTAFGRRVLDLLRREGTAIEVAAAGQRIAVPGEPGLVLDILWPPSGGLPEHYLVDPNAMSLVVRARYLNAAFLFAGDINAAQELDLVRQPCRGASVPCDLRADVLKVAHQGSRYSSTSLFLESVRPSIAVLSAGANNPHGHPHQSVVRNLGRIGSQTLLTAARGDISILTDGHRISVETER
ncbi:MAG: ComEC/Rec2 family competence protein [Chloroflexi bacterium]|nr:ComEC/Rec2 family competence protein [Chloroflexota bacterium]